MWVGLVMGEGPVDEPVDPPEPPPSLSNLFIKFEIREAFEEALCLFTEALVSFEAALTGPLRVAFAAVPLLAAILLPGTFPTAGLVLAAVENGLGSLATDEGGRGGGRVGSGWDD